MIVWGNTSEGSRVFIADAERGSAQGLLCECGSPLTARKGDVNAHHFAHQSGQITICKAAQIAALSDFACRSIQASAHIRGPDLLGRSKIYHVIEARSHLIDDCVFIECMTDTGSIFAAIHARRREFDSFIPHFVAKGLTAFRVDISRHRNQSDAHIEAAIASLAKREWIYNADVLSQTRQAGPQLSTSELLERLFPEETHNTRGVGRGRHTKKGA